MTRFTLDNANTWTLDTRKLKNKYKNTFKLSQGEKILYFAFNLGVEKMLHWGVPFTFGNGDFWNFLFLLCSKHYLNSNKQVVLLFHALGGLLEKFRASPRNFAVCENFWIEYKTFLFLYFRLLRVKNTSFLLAIMNFLCF